MFVIVKQESFATVSVGILKLLFSVLLLEFQSEGSSSVCPYEGNMFWIYFQNANFFYDCECSVFESRDFMVTFCCLCCSAKAC